MDDRLISDRFPLASRYHPEWVLAGVSGAANPLWMTEWLCESLNLQPGMRVLDLGCGRAMSSIFLRREFGVQVWATDLWFSASENLQRIRDAGVEDGVFPIHADARALPFAAEFFDVSCRSILSSITARTTCTSITSPGLSGREGRSGSPGRIDARDGRPISRHTSRSGGPQTTWCLHSAAWWSGTGNGPASSTSRWPTRCPMAGGCGGIGCGSSPPTTRRRSGRWKPTPVAISVTFES